MKRAVFSLLLALCLLLLASCGEAVPNYTEANNTLLGDATVSRVEVSSMPHGYSYSFRGDDAEAVVDYIRSLTLESDFAENPDVYVGMTWVVEIEYDGAEKATVYMFGNIFIRRDSSEWLKMEYSEAEGFASLLEKLDK